MFIRIAAFLLVIAPFDQLMAQGNLAGEKYVMVIHGGAGTILKSQMTPEKEKAYKAALTLALETGYKKIKAGESSLNAVEAAV
ncbi:MAG TPA: isoaspartyl peptidase/L-asparaginase, partial [Daejeonella sp.]|nr:isoaspartyl peptidase/L-asparaginase [Daejeonella sp.]